MSGPVTPTDAPVDDEREAPSAPCVERHASRQVDVAGMPVRRALPKRDRRTIGAWCFADHFGPAGTGALMQVGPHPHIGLQTATWLLEGEVLHRDSLGSEQLIRPGQLNLMTAGDGIAHAEETPDGASERQHGIQLWIAQPEPTRHGPPAFEHHADLPVIERGGWRATVLTGDLDGATSPARADTPLLGVALGAASTAAASLPLDPTFEHGVVVLRGEVALDEELVAPGELVYLGLGRDELSVRTTDATDLVLLGGAPFDDELAMWWNFVARSRDEIDAARRDWDAHSDRFGPVRSRLSRIEAPQG